MKVLVACEESQEVCKAFRERGHEAYSCDIQDCSGGHPEWHIKGDVLRYVNGNCDFITWGGYGKVLKDGILSSLILRVLILRFPVQGGSRKSRRTSVSRKRVCFSCR